MPKKLVTYHDVHKNALSQEMSIQKILATK